VLEQAFEALLQSLEPAIDFQSALRAMIEKAWDQHAHPLTPDALSRMPSAHASAGVCARDARFRQLADQQEIAAQVHVTGVPSSTRELDRSARNALAFLANPYHVWKTGSFEIKRIMAKLAFTDGLTWSTHRGIEAVSAPTLFRLRQ
jgi:hypothetical protein